MRSASPQRSRVWISRCRLLSRRSFFGLGFLGALSGTVFGSQNVSKNVAEELLERFGFPYLDICRSNALFFAKDGSLLWEEDHPDWREKLDRVVVYSNEFNDIHSIPAEAYGKGTYHYDEPIGHIKTRDAAFIEALIRYGVSYDDARWIDQRLCTLCSKGIRDVVGAAAKEDYFWWNDTWQPDCMGCGAWHISSDGQRHFRRVA